MPSWQRIPLQLLPHSKAVLSHRLFSTSTASHSKNPPALSSSSSTTDSPTALKLTHLTSAGTAHMVSIISKVSTSRTAVAVCSVHFSNHTPLRLIAENANKKGDVLGVARIAGIMASKKTPELVPLCHPVMVSFVGVEVEVAGAEGSGGEKERVSVGGGGRGQGDRYVREWRKDDAPSANPPNAAADAEAGGSGNGRIDITATVSCEGKTGVEMEALTAASVAALTVYDMCKAVDKGMRIEGLRVTRKEGGKSGTWIEGEREEGE